MKRLTIIPAAIFSILFSAGALSETNYFGGNIASVKLSEDGDDQTASLTAIYGRLGTKLSENFSTEIRVGFGVGDDTLQYATDVNVELDSVYGGYIRGGVPVSDSIFPYAVIGYTRGEVTYSTSYISVSDSESDVSFGLGADINVNPSLAVNVEYMNYLDKEGTEISGFSIGLVSFF